MSNLYAYFILSKQKNHTANVGVNSYEKDKNPYRTQWVAALYFTLPRSNRSYYEPAEDSLRPAIHKRSPPPYFILIGSFFVLTTIAVQRFFNVQTYYAQLIECIFTVLLSN